MTIANPTAARTALYADLSSLTVTVQQAVRLPLPKPVCVALSPAGQTATDFLVAVGVYADATVDPVGAQGSVEQTMYDVDRLLAQTPRADWTVTYEVTLEAWHASTVVSVGREDF